ncbi:hypothetical protein TrRE_jg12090, partial [Triparma retinervis]
MDVINECFETRTRTIWFYFYDLDYKDEEEVNPNRKLGEMMERIEEQPKVDGNVGGITELWYMAYLDYLFGVKKFEDGEESTGFGEHSSEFLTSDSCLGGSCGSYALDVLGNVTPSGPLSTMLGSTFTALKRSPFETEEMWRFYKQVKGAATSTGLNIMVNMMHRMTAETNEVNTEYLWRSLFTTLVAVFLVCLVLSNSLVAYEVALTMVLLDCTLVGLSSYSGVKLSVISFACVIMSVGLCVNYLLHMAQKCVKEVNLLRTLKTGDVHSCGRECAMDSKTQLDNRNSCGSFSPRMHSTMLTKIMPNRSARTTSKRLQSTVRGWSSLARLFFIIVGFLQVVQGLEGSQHIQVGSSIIRAKGDGKFNQKTFAPTTSLFHFDNGGSLIEEFLE